MKTPGGQRTEQARGQAAGYPKGRRAAPRLTVVVTGARGALATALRRVCRETLSREKHASGRIEVAVADGARMRTLHRQWMADDAPTDVLTFDLRDHPVKGCVDGQLVVCETVARERMRRGGGDWRSELLLYAVHGCLHLCGYDDRRKADAARMHRREDEILTELGYGPVFSVANAESVARTTNRATKKRARGKTGKASRTRRR